MSKAKPRFRHKKAQPAKQDGHQPTQTDASVTTPAPDQLSPSNDGKDATIKSLNTSMNFLAMLRPDMPRTLTASHLLGVFAGTETLTDNELAWCQNAKNLPVPVRDKLTTLVNTSGKQTNTGTDNGEKEGVNVAHKQPLPYNPLRTKFPTRR